MAFTSVTGMPGVMFVLGASQALAVVLISDRRRRVVGVVTLAGLLAVVAAVDLVILMQKPIGHLKVAAVGWVFDREYGDPGNEQGFARLYTEPVAEAARQGARLVVAPEVAFAIYDDPEHDPFARFVELARQHNVYLVVGYLDVRTDRNAAAFIGPTEGVMARYTKVHMTPFESSPPGDGEPVTIAIEGVSIGALICHDDDYTDIARRYGRQGTGVVAVPTNDWRHVRHAHFQSMIHRAIESRFAIVRAASNGISAIIAPHGQVLDIRDHFRDGPGLVMADVPVYHTRTISSRYGHWFVAVCVILLAGHIVRRKRHE
jgi:apolipoprotein N-acyltransferase